MNFTPKYFEKFFLDYSLDAELGGDQYTTKAFGGYWLEFSSPCGTRKWPVCFSTKNFTHKRVHC